MKNTHAESPFSSGTIMLAFVAVMIGLSGTYAFRAYSREPDVVAPPPPTPPAKPKPVTVPLASRDIPAGTEIMLDDVALYKMSQEEIQTKFKSASFMMNPTQIIGKISLVEIKRNRPFKTADFYPTGQIPGIAQRLKAGLRAVTVQLTAQNALIGYAGPGQHVDVLFRYGEEGDATSAGGRQGQGHTGTGFYPQHHDFNPPRSRDYYGNAIGGYGGANASNLQESGLAGATTTLVQDAELLAVGHRSTPIDAASSLPTEEHVHVTLAVTPRQAELLRVARGHGELSLTLRNPDDSDQVPLLDPVTIDQIIDSEHTMHEMEIYRGTQVTRLQFNHGKFIKQRVFANDTGAVPGASEPTATTSAGSVPLQFPAIVPFWIPPNMAYGPVVDEMQGRAKQEAATTTTEPTPVAVEVHP